MRNPAVSSGWFVYLLLCADGSLYAGITTDVERRVVEHNTDDILGARYTRCRRPVELAYVEGAGSRSDATRRELALKKLRRREKLALILGSSAVSRN
jgi:putative endonuclease